MNRPQKGAAGRRKAYLLLALLLSGNILLFYGLPMKVLVAIFLSVSAIYVVIGGSNALLVTFSLVASTIFVETALQTSALGDSIYYRAHERFAIDDTDLGYRRYQANVDYKGSMPHGDLHALAVSTDVDPEPREIVFKTDSFGFRNDDDYDGQPYVLVGDSFVVGAGTTQEETLVSQLRSRYAMDLYSLAHQGGIEDYAKYVRTFRNRLSAEPKVVLFIFEGNDFPEQGVRKMNTVSVQRHWSFRVPGGQRLLMVQQRTVEVLKRYHALFKTTSTYRFTRSLVGRISTRDEQVVVFPVGDIAVAFYRRYISVSKRKEVPENKNFVEMLEEMKDILVHVFFIPTKFRVYCKHLTSCSSEGLAALPNVQWLYLRDLGEKLGIATTDLTPALAKESDRLLEDGVLTFWRDDTHWNQHGIAVAAGRVAKTLAQSNSPVSPK